MPPSNASILIKKAKHKELVGYYRQASKRLIKELTSATDFGFANRLAILQRISRILNDLDKRTARWLDNQLEDYYKKYARRVDKTLESEGFQTLQGFTAIDEEAIKSITDGSLQYYREAHSGIKRTAMRMLDEANRKQIKALIAEGRISGVTRQEIADRIAGQLKEGFVVLIDKGGRRWRAETYADMLARTAAVRSANEGIKNRLSQNGFDLVQVTQHEGACPLCVPWELKILSINGKHPDYPSTDEAEAEGLFHPNCRHRLEPYHEGLAEVSSVYNPNTGHYITP